MKICSYHTFAFICVITLSGCGFNPVKLDASQVIDLECGAEPKVDRLHMRVVKPWIIDDIGGITWVGISPDHYENLSINIADVKKQLKQRVSVNKFYRKCIEDFNSAPEAISE